MKMTRIVSGTMTASAFFRPLFAFVFARPTEAIAGRQLHFLVDLFDRVFHRGPQVPAPHVEGDRHVAAIAFAVDVVRAVLDLNLG